MRPKRIVLVRHGQSTGNEDHSVYERVPDWKVPLTERGHLQAIDAGKRLLRDFGLTSFNHPTKSHALQTAFYTSPYIRTQQTCDGLVKAFDGYVTSRREDPRIVEQNRGNKRTLTPAQYDVMDIEREDYGPFFFRFPHGESGLEVYLRAAAFVDSLYGDFEKDDFPPNAVIVTHSFTLRILLMYMLGLTVDQFHLLPDPFNCGYVALEWDDKWVAKDMVNLRRETP